MNLLNKAIEIASVAHSGQVDKAGEPYILHPLRVMLSVSTENERICAVLHDVIEDSDITIQQLSQLGFPAEILAVLPLLTKQRGETYEEFISRLLPNQVACQVKLADLCDNMDLSRIPEPSELDFERLHKYKTAKERITKSLKQYKKHAKIRSSITGFEISSYTGSMLGPDDIGKVVGTKTFISVEGLIRVTVERHMIKFDTELTDVETEIYEYKIPKEEMADKIFGKFDLSILESGDKNDRGCDMGGWSLTVYSDKGDFGFTGTYAAKPFGKELAKTILKLVKYKVKPWIFEY